MLASANFPFTISLMVMLIIALLEGVTTLLGSGIFSFLDSLLPDIDMDIDMDAPNLDQAGHFTKFLAWIKIGEVPAIVLLVLLLTSFGLFGLAIQLLVQATAGFLLPALLVSFPAFFLALIVVRTCGTILSKVIPKDETDAVSEETFVGRLAVITIGRASVGNPAQAKLQDAFGQTHYIMVEPDCRESTFQQGQTVLILQRNGSIFQATDQVPDCLVSP